jgi:hypothetical protein
MRSAPARQLTLVIAAREALSTGDTIYADELLEDLEREVRGRVVHRHRCAECGRKFRWPGQLEHHQLEAHGWRASILTTFSGSHLSTGVPASTSTASPDVIGLDVAARDNDF